jgi:uncharacterized protein (TIGR02145 family)
MRKITNLLVLICLLFGIVLINSCKKDKNLAVLTTTAVSEVTISSGTSGGVITDGGGADITARGVCWSTSVNPTISGVQHTTDGKGTGSFTSLITDLDPDTKYYVKAYATNSVGTAYGNQVDFTTTAIVIPTVTTTTVSSPGLTSAVSGGAITSDGNGSISAKGVCWSTSANPTPLLTTKTDEGAGTASFSSNLTGLSPSTTYYYRAYATNQVGTGYGTELTFTTPALATPTITTTPVTSPTLTSAVSGGTITTDGGASVTAKGICWSTSPTPTVGLTTKTDEGPGIASFSSTMTNLTAGTTYYVRAYATNSVGTGYGDAVQFSTSPVEKPTVETVIVETSTITQTSAISGGTISADGGGAITAKGVCWSTSQAPTVALATKTDQGGGITSFSSNIINLTAGTTYYYRAYATNSAGTSYGPEHSFLTDPVVEPTVTTVTASSITQTSAVSGGTIPSNGGGAITAKGVCWSTSPGPTALLPTKTDQGGGSTSFSSNLTNLLPGTPYYYRAYATNSAGTSYGTEHTFTTDPVTKATLTTTNVSSINTTTAVSGGVITTDGGGTISEKGVCWSVNPSPTTDDATAAGTGTTSFTSNLSSLLTGTTYYVRAYAINEAGPAYGNQIIFNTKLADVDGNSYNVVIIGTQMWMAENLKTTKFNGGAAITHQTSDDAWAQDSLTLTPAYCSYDNSSTNMNTYGAMYNWFAVDAGNLCPTDWHVPTDADFNTLELHLGMSVADVNLYGMRGTDQGAQLKNTSGWADGENGTNTSGFSALPGGYRYYYDGTFQAAGQWSYWWSSDELNADRAWYRRLDGNSSGVFRGAVNKPAGKYVRCVKD